MRVSLPERVDLVVRAEPTGRATDSLEAFAVMRPAAVDDAELLGKAVIESLEHLRPWMPWASVEAADPGFQRDRLERATSPEAIELEAHYHLLDPPETRLLGTISLMDRIGPRALELGYWVHVNHTGRGLITQAAAVLTEAALASPSIDRVEIHCDEANHASAAIPRRLGYRLERVTDRPIQAPGEIGREMIWARRR
jgi:RimJ/RimL family protein N-acetyltransferase